MAAARALLLETSDAAECCGAMAGILAMSVLSVLLSCCQSCSVAVCRTSTGDGLSPFAMHAVSVTVTTMLSPVHLDNSDSDNDNDNDAPGPQRCLAVCCTTAGGAESTVISAALAS